MAISATPAQTRTGIPFPFPLMGGPPRLRPHCIRPLRCPQKRGRTSRLGTARQRSCALAHALAEQSGGAEDEDQDQHEERENVLVVAAEHADLAVARRTLLLQ